ncbi:MAG TPA: trypsin-like peptidase domain-containing protein [Trichormus sp. M33_DOE_039]|nr:trypsin-like peptidase domain-containing protein [Trichormus sp. M33_DOE_039]
MGSNFEQNTSTIQEYWLKHGTISIGPFEVSVIGGLVGNTPLESEAFDKILAIVKERSQMESHTLVTAAIRKEDFLPIYFLQNGIKQSISVCRIARYFSLQAFQEFVADIEAAIAQLSNLTNNFETSDKVIEVFSIPEQVADELFDQETKSAINSGQKTALAVLKNITEQQLAKVNPIPIGTGFLVGGSHLLTNHHVIPNAAIAEQCVAQFNYVENDRGDLQKSIDYEFDPRILFISEPSLDYTLVQLKSDIFTRQAGYELGWLQLIEDFESIKPRLSFIEFPANIDRVSTESDLVEIIRTLECQGYIVNKNPNSIEVWHPENKFDDVPQELINLMTLLEEKDVMNSGKPINITKYRKAQIGDSLIIIQHPKGKRKQIVLNDNEVNSLYKNYVRYQADSDYGSSGSPVFNTRWQLVALHHAIIKQADDSKNAVQQAHPDLAVEQQGIRICRLIEDLKKKSVSDSKIKSFIEDFVVTAEELNYPPLISALEFDGEGSYIDCGNDESLKIDREITIEAWVRNNDPNSDGVIFYRGGSFDEPGYCIWRYGKKIRVELKGSDDRKIIFDTDQTFLDDPYWHHIAFTWEPNSGIKIYVDGVERKAHFELGDSKFSLENIDNTNVSLTIGRAESIEKIIENLFKKIKEDPDNRFIIKDYFNRPSAKLRLEIARRYYFNGSITEVRLWNIARTPEQIKKNMFRRLSKQDSERLTEQDAYWSDLVGYWQMEESVGNKVYNLKSEISNSPILSSKISDLPPQPNFGLLLDGLSDHVNCSKFKFLQNENEITAITIEAWVKNGNEGSNGMIVHQGGGWDEDGYSIWRCKGKIRVELQNTANQSKIVVDTNNNFLDDQDWHHVAFTWEKGAEIKVYIDGEQQLINPSSEGKSTPLGDSVGIPQVSLNIGCSQNYGRYFYGSIAEVRLWNVARTPEQIQKNMKSQLSNDDPNWSNLTGYWRLDEEEGNRAVNSASMKDSRDEDGVVYGGRWLKAYSLIENNQGSYGVVFKAKSIRASQSPALPMPCGLKFNDSEHYVECGNGQENNQSLNVTDAITVEVWIKHKFGNCLIISRIDDNSNGYSLSWYEGKIQVKLQRKINIQNTEKEQIEKTVIYTKDNALQDQIWHHVAFTWDKSHEISIYIDGRIQDCVVEGQCKTIMFAGQTKSIGLFTGPLDNLEEPFIIGCNQQAMLALSQKEKTYYNIAVTEVRLWKIARTQTQIQKNMYRRLSKQDSERLNEQEQYWSDLVGYWRLDDGGQDNTQARNFKSSNNHGKIYGAEWFPPSPILPTS